MLGIIFVISAAVITLAPWGFHYRSLEYLDVSHWINHQILHKAIVPNVDK